MKHILTTLLFASLISTSALADSAIRCVSGTDSEFGWKEYSYIDFIWLQKEKLPCMAKAFYGNACFIGEPKYIASLLASKNFAQKLEAQKYIPAASPFFENKVGYYLRNVTNVYTDTKDGYDYDMVVFMAHETSVDGKKVDKAVVLKRCIK